MPQLLSRGAVQSAHRALIAAGAAVPVVVIVTRKINPDATYGTDQTWEPHSSVPFEFGSLQLWDPA